jgi:transposase
MPCASNKKEQAETPEWTLAASESQFQPEQEVNTTVFLVVSGTQRQVVQKEGVWREMWRSERRFCKTLMGSIIKILGTYLSSMLSTVHILLDLKFAF